jgi:hypothetical protein
VVHHALFLEVRPEGLEAQALGLEGQVLDRFTLKRP